MSLLGNRPGGSFLSWWDSLRESYWFVPMVMAVGAAALSTALIALDDHIASQEARTIPWIQDAGAEGTRLLLSTVVGSMITVTGVVFSITIVALTLASSQFGPRLLRNFLRDRANQMVLGTFVATFLYSLLVLRSVEADRVPYLATAVALALAVTSVFVLIYFIHHAASSIQASSVIAGVARQIESELPSLFPEELGAAPECEEPVGAADRFAEASDVTSADSGYVRVVVAESLFAMAARRDLAVELLARPGDFLTEGDLVARVIPADRIGDELVACIRESFVLGERRTAVQDLLFLTDQLAEMAVRALSPGTNDPKTAVACVHRLGVVIATLGRRKMPATEHCDDEGTVRIVARATRFEEIVASCLDPIRRYGIDDAEVVVSVLRALTAALRQCPDAGRREILLEHAREWADGFLRADAAKRDRSLVSEAAKLVESAAIRSVQEPSA